MHYYLYHSLSKFVSDIQEWRHNHSYSCQWDCYLCKIANITPPTDPATPLANVLTKYFPNVNF